MKKMYLNAAGGLLAGLLLFSCSKDELATEQTINNPNQFSDISEIDNDNIIKAILNNNTEIIELNYDTSIGESTLLKGNNVNNLTLDIGEEFCGRNGFDEVVCTTDFYKIGGVDKNNAQTFTPVFPCPYTKKGRSADVQYFSPGNPYPTLGVINQFFDPILEFYYYRLEMPLKTNDEIRITSNYGEFHIGLSSGIRNTLTSSLPEGAILSGLVNVYLKDFITKETIAVIAENIIDPDSADGLFIDWEIPSSIPSGEYFIEIQDNEDPTIKNYEHFISKLVIENTEVPEEITDIINAEGVILSPGAVYNYNLGFNLGEITVEWDPSVFDQDFVKITMSSINFMDIPVALTEKHSGWVANSGTYTIPADNYGTFATGFLTIQSNSKGTGKNFTITN